MLRLDGYKETDRLGRDFTKSDTYQVLLAEIIIQNNKVLFKKEKTEPYQYFIPAWRGYLYMPRQRLYELYRNIIFKQFFSSTNKLWILRSPILHMSGGIRHQTRLYLLRFGAPRFGRMHYTPEEGWQIYKFIPI
jgi:hypothetical protein